MVRREVSGVELVERALDGSPRWTAAGAFVLAPAEGSGEAVGGTRTAAGRRAGRCTGPVAVGT
jgi:hypothetical protein